MNKKSLKNINKPLMQTGYTWEWCPHCGVEVMLLKIFKIQLCPSCGLHGNKKNILPCSICDETNDKVDNDFDCNSCPLVDQNYAECKHLYEVIPAPFGQTMSSPGYSCKRNGGRCPLWAEGKTCWQFKSGFDRSESI